MILADLCVGICQVCFSTPKMTPPALPRPAPEPAKLNDESVARVRDDTLRRARSAAGPASTIRANPSSGLGDALYGTKTLLGQ